MQKMPTIQLYKNGTKIVEHIAAESAIDALDRVRLRAAAVGLVT